MEKHLDIDLLTRLEEISNICIGNESPDEVGAGELSTLPEIFSLIQYNQGNKEYLMQGLRKTKLLEEKIKYIREKLEVLDKKQKYGLVKD